MCIIKYLILFCASSDDAFLGGCSPPMTICIDFRIAHSALSSVRFCCFFFSFSFRFYCLFVFLLAMPPMRFVFQHFFFLFFRSILRSVSIVFIRYVNTVRLYVGKNDKTRFGEMSFESVYIYIYIYAAANVRRNTRGIITHHVYCYYCYYTVMSWMGLSVLLCDYDNGGRNTDIAPNAKTSARRRRYSTISISLSAYTSRNCSP